MPSFNEEEGVIDNRRTSGRLDYYSEAHKVTINLQAFDCFIRNQLEKQDQIDNHVYPTLVTAAAERLCAGTLQQLRDIKCDDDCGNIRWFMHSTYLPVASMLQFVESGVKEAKYVSATDRSEVIRSCLAIIRSATPLGKNKHIEELSFLVNKILAIQQSAVDRSKPHEDWIEAQVDHSYDARFNQVHYSMKQGHFRDERVEAKKTKVDDQGSKFKKQNIHQKAKNQTLTAAVTGLIPHGKLTKTRNMLDLEEELLFRGINIDELPISVTERKDMLKNLEIERLTEEGVREEDAAKLKHFKKQSNAAFRLTDS